MTKGFHRFFRTASLLVAAPLLLGGAAEAASWTARGNEPGWHIDVSDSAISFSSMEGETFSIEPVPEPVRAEDIEVYTGTAGDKAFTLVAIDKICTDNMSGMPFPKAVVVTIGERALVGCGGDPLSLLIGDWKVEEIAGEPVIATSETSLAFDLDGSMHGNASCNRFFGGFSLTGEGLTLSPGGATMMACETGLMEQEQKFLAALEQVNRFESLADGRLRLVDVEGNTVLALRQ
ncbi:META domain-containing protein [Devosia riboflavina]|uniref:META domain-containing protein n=1 Tax=Devosia riboflavina TaxID=46914 RepID=UPI00068B71E0|nr:META domain-containing protein [Devosia riboflavina]